MHLLGGACEDPVFIMGDHRSGTTLLHMLLAATGCFDVVTAYHVIDYGSIVAHRARQSEESARQALAARFASLGLTDRQIDGVRVAPELPEEYAFILRRAGHGLRLRPANLWLFHEMCRKMRYASESTRPLLLKSPYDFVNFRYIQAVLPRARFLFIHRHPLDVISSRLRAIRTVLAKRNAYYALLDPGYGRLMASPIQSAIARWIFAPASRRGLGLVTAHVARTTSHYVRHIGSVPERSRFILRYERLCEDPEQGIGAALDFLGLTPVRQPNYRALVQPRRTPLPDEISAVAHRLTVRLRPYLAAAGYDHQEGSAGASRGDLPAGGGGGAAPTCRVTSRPKSRAGGPRCSPRS